MSEVANLSCPHCKGGVAVSVNSFIDEAETFDLTARAMGQMIDARSCAEILRAGAESIEGYAARLGRSTVALLVGCETNGPEFRAKLLLSRKPESNPHEPVATGTIDTTPPDDSAMADERRYAAQTTFLPQLASVIEEWYGERCSDDHADCVVCQLWRAYDILSSFEE